MPGWCIISATEVVFSAFLPSFFFPLPSHTAFLVFSSATTRGSFCFSERCWKNKASRIFSSSSRGLLGYNATAGLRV